MTTCNDCKHWNTPFPYGCDKMVADTGEVLHYREKAKEKCDDFKKRR